MYNRTSDSAPQAGPGQRGFATLATLIIGVCLVGIVLAATDVAITQTRLSRNGSSKANALFVADAGIDQAMVELQENHGWAGQSGNTAVSSLGTYTSTATLSGDKFSAVIHSVGKLSDNTGATSKAVGVVSFKPIGLGDAAIRADSSVTIGGNASVAGVNESGATTYDADIRSGASISMSSSSSVDDGTMYAVGTITAPATGTQGIQGEYPGSALPPLPDPTTVQQQLQAQAGGSSSAITWATAKTKWNTGTGGVLNMTIPAGTYITGDLSMNNGDVVTFSGTGTVYINGSVKMSGGTMTNSLVGTLGVAGTFSMSGTSAYTATPSDQISPDGLHKLAPTLAVFNNGSSSGTAITLNGTSGTDEVGIVYAAYGDMKLTGGNIFEGAFAAAGQVTANGGFTQTYPDWQRSAIYLPGNPTLTFWGEEQ